MLRVDPGGLQLTGGGGHRLGPGDVAARRHRTALAQALPDDHAFDRRHGAQRVVQGLLRRYLAAATQRAVCAYDGLCAGVREALRDRRRREAGEDRAPELRRGVRRRARRSPPAATSAGGGRRDRRHRRPAAASASAKRVTASESSANESTARAPVLPGEDGRWSVRSRVRVAVHAVPGDVQPRAGEPRGPLDASGVVEDALPRCLELQREVLDGGRPEPLRLLLGATHELPIACDAVAPHQARDVRALHFLGAGPPDDLRHRRSR